MGHPLKIPKSHTISENLVKSPPLNYNPLAILSTNSRAIRCYYSKKHFVLVHLFICRDPDGSKATSIDLVFFFRLRENGSGESRVYQSFALRKSDCWDLTQSGWNGTENHEVIEKHWCLFAGTMIAWLALRSRSLSPGHFREIYRVVQGHLRHVTAAQTTR